MRVLSSTECHRTLEELRPNIGDYRWLWLLLRMRARQIDGFFPVRLFTKLRPLLRKRYFEGRLADGTCFVGDLDDLYSAGCAVAPERDAWLVSLLSGLADRHPGTVLDVGSNQGAIAAAVGRRIAPSRKLVAFEPMPETAKRAAATLALNRVSGANVVAIAVGSTDDPVTFHVLDGHSDLVTAGSVEQSADSNYRSLSIESRRLDSLLDDLLSEPVGLIKIDVEGFEPHVVRGAQKLIARDRPAIVFEYWPEVANRIGWHIDDVTKMISSAGGDYRFEAYDDGKRLTYPLSPGGGLCDIVASPIPG